MSGACQISLVDKSAIVALWNSTDQKASNIWNRTENVHTQSVEKDRAILPKVSLQKHPKANKGSCWCAKGSHQIFNVYCTWNLHHFLFIWWCSWQTVPAPLNSMLSFLDLIRSFFKFLVADTQLYKSLCPSISPSVGPSVENCENAHFRPCPPVRDWYWPCIRPCFL